MPRATSGCIQRAARLPPLQNRITAVESVGAIHESPVQAFPNLYHVGCAYRRVRDAARYERVHMAGGKVAAPTK